MLFGLIARTGTFAVNAGLLFLLSQRAPQLDWWNVPPEPTVIENARNTVLAGLARVRTDLETNGKLLFPVRDTAGGALALDLEMPALQLDQRHPATHIRTD